MGHPKFRSGAPSSGFYALFSKKRFWFFDFSGFCCNLPRKLLKSLILKLKSTFFFKFRDVFLKYTTQIINMGPLTSKMFFHKILIKILRVTGNFGRGPLIDDLEPLFQKSKPEISANWEKTCFFCCWFFWKIEEIGGYYWGCAPKLFL